MAEYDLTPKIGPFLDRHLVFPLLEFLQQKNIYPEEELLRGKLELLQKTNLVDFAMDIYKKLHNTDEDPPELKAQRQKVIDLLRKLRTEVAPLTEILKDKDNVKSLIDQKLFNFQYLNQNYKISEQTVEYFYLWAKFQFECGNYSGANEFLYYYLFLSTNEEHRFNALWGKLASVILLGNSWEEALQDFEKLRDAIESRVFQSPLQLLQQRSWLIHWSLFIYFNEPSRRNDIVDFLMQDKYLQTIQINCPHILRYLAAAVIINKKKKVQMKDLVSVIEQESHSYRDPITEFIESLYVNCDFDAAQENLKKCEKVTLNDPFLVSITDDFIESARLLIFETYCRIHHVIDISMIAERLNMDKDRAERWVANLIRNARLQAKIDSQTNRVIMTPHHSNIYQQVIAKTEDISFRTFMIKGNLDRRIYQLEKAQQKQQ